MKLGLHGRVVTASGWESKGLGFEPRLGNLSPWVAKQLIKNSNRI